MTWWLRSPGRDTGSTGPAPEAAQRRNGTPASGSAKGVSLIACLVNHC